jgi:DNA-binding NarL/FixJ family response regulator
MAHAGQIRVLIADDHTMVRQALRNALQAFPNIDVVGEAGDGDEAVAPTAKLQPEVVMMDVNMAKMDGLTATRLIKAQHQEIAVNRTFRRFKGLPVSLAEECRSLSGP